MASVAVKAGEVYRAKVRRGFRYVEVQSVRDKKGTPYAMLREVLPSGKLATGRDRHGILRSAPWYSNLAFDGKAWRMNSQYEGPLQLPVNPGKPTEGESDND